MGIFEKYLTVWVFLAIILGWVFGIILPEAFQFISTLTIFGTNGVIATFNMVNDFPNDVPN